MSPSDTRHAEPGDKVTITVAGTVVSPVYASSDYPTMVHISRLADPLMFRGADPVAVDLCLSPAAAVTAEVVSPHRNGVHIDADGTYWMRRPDGWYRMRVDSAPLPRAAGPAAPSRPRRPRRLKEAREK